MPRTPRHSAITVLGLVALIASLPGCGATHEPSVTMSQATLDTGGKIPIEVDPVTAKVPAVNRVDPAVARIVREAAASGALQRAIRGSRFVVRDTGTGKGRVTVLADVRPAVQGVSAVLPQAQDGGPYRMRAKILRDLVLDVDMTRKRLVGIQPGPDSDVTSWSPVNADWANAERSEEEPPTYRPKRPPHLIKLSDHGPAFLSQDGGLSLSSGDRDWPVSMVFTGNASIATVKAGLRTLGLKRVGTPRYLLYRTTDGVLGLDSDRGLKSACDGDATDLHVRPYAPPAADRFVDHQVGGFVVATVHIDHRDGCGAGPQFFGFSEYAERRLASLIARKLGWRVTLDQYPLGNAEPLRRDATDPTHVWQADGRATGVLVP